MLCLAEVVCFCCVWGRGDPLQRINEDKLIYQGYYSHRLVIRNYGLKKDLYNSVFYEKKKPLHLQCPAGHGKKNNCPGSRHSSIIDLVCTWCQIVGIAEHVISV